LIICQFDHLKVAKTG